MAIDNSVREALKELVLTIRSRAKLSGKSSVFCIGTTMNVCNPEYFFSSIREAHNAICANLMINSIEDLGEILNIIEGQIDEVLIDVEKKKKECIEVDTIVNKALKKTKVGFYRGNAITADAFEYFFFQYCRNRQIDFISKKVCIIGLGNLGAKLANILAEYGMHVYVYSRNEEKANQTTHAINTLLAPHCRGQVKTITANTIKNNKYVCIIGATNGIKVVTQDMLKSLNKSGFIIDAGLGTVDDGTIKNAAELSIPVLCLITLPGFNGMMIGKDQAQKNVRNVGRKKIEGNFSLVSGGVIGAYGDVIVDSVSNPIKIIGIAKGDGIVLTGDEKKKFLDREEFVNKTYIEGRINENR